MLDCLVSVFQAWTCVNQQLQLVHEDSTCRITRLRSCSRWMSISRASGQQCRGLNSEGYQGSTYTDISMLSKHGCFHATAVPAWIFKLNSWLKFAFQGQHWTVLLTVGSTSQQGGGSLPTLDALWLQPAYASLFTLPMLLTTRRIYQTWLLASFSILHRCSL